MLIRDMRAKCLILIDRGDIALREGVILEIGQRHIGVSRAEAVREQRIDQIVEALAEHAGREHVRRPAAPA